MFNRTRIAKSISLLFLILGGAIPFVAYTAEAAGYEPSLCSNSDASNLRIPGGYQLDACYNRATRTLHVRNTSDLFVQLSKPGPTARITYDVSDSGTDEVILHTGYARNFLSSEDIGLILPPNGVASITLLNTSLDIPITYSLQDSLNTKLVTVQIFTQYFPVTASSYDQIEAVSKALIQYQLCTQAKRALCQTRFVEAIPKLFYKLILKKWKTVVKIIEAGLTATKLTQTALGATKTLYVAKGPKTFVLNMGSLASAQTPAVPTPVTPTPVTPTPVTPTPVTPTPVTPTPVARASFSAVSENFRPLDELSAVLRCGQAGGYGINLGVQSVSKSIEVPFYGACVLGLLGRSCDPLRVAILLNGSLVFDGSVDNQSESSISVPDPERIQLEIKAYRQNVAETRGPDYGEVKMVTQSALVPVSRPLSPGDPLLYGFNFRNTSTTTWKTTFWVTIYITRPDGSLVRKADGQVDFGGQCQNGDPYTLQPGQLGSCGVTVNYQGPGTYQIIPMFMLVKPGSAGNLSSTEFSLSNG